MQLALVIHPTTGLHYRTGVHANVTEQVGLSGHVQDVYLLGSQTESQPHQKLL